MHRLFPAPLSPRLPENGARELLNCCQPRMYADHTHTINVDVESRLRNSIRPQAGPRNRAPRVRIETESKFRFYSGERGRACRADSSPSALMPLIIGSDGDRRYLSRILTQLSQLREHGGARCGALRLYLLERCIRDGNARRGVIEYGTKDSPISPIGLSSVTNLGAHARGLRSSAQRRCASRALNEISRGGSAKSPNGRRRSKSP